MSNHLAMTHISRGKLIYLAAALLFGGWLGFFANRAFAGGGLSAAGGVGGVAFGVIVVLLLSLWALVISKQPDGRGGPAARVTLLGAGLVVASFGGGWGVATAFPSLSVLEPEAQATGSVTLSVVGLPSARLQAESPATCRPASGLDSVGWVEAANAGTLGADTVAAYLALDPRDPDLRASIVVSIAPAVKGAGAAPVWSGPADLVDLASDLSTGRVVFTGIPLDVDDSGFPSPNPGDSSGGQPVSWPLEISGSLTWTCNEWN